MIRLFIVEDETLMRQGIIHMLNWVEHGFLIVGQAANGAEALEKIESCCPDIVITDVKMPVMDGITLTKELAFHYPNIKIIILSSHSDFQYVRDTLRLGASDYILKQEISTENVLAVLNRVAILLKKSDKGVVPSNQQSEIFCNLLRTPHQQPEVCSKIIRQAKIELLDRNMVIVLFMASYLSKSKISKDYLSSFAKILEKYCDQLYHFTVIITDNNELLLIYNISNDTGPSQSENQIYLEFIEHIKNEYNISFNALIGAPFDGYENIYTMYQRVLDLEQLSFYFPDTQLYDISKFPSVFTNKPFDYKELRSMVEELKLTEIYNVTDNLLKDCFETNLFFNVNELKKQLMDIINYIAFRLTEKEFRMDDMNTFRVSYLQGIEHSSNYKLLLLALKNALDSFVSFIEGNNSLYANSNIDKTVQYIEDNYSDNISLTTAANHLYLNKNYLSTLFKNSTGISFTDYLTNVRMQHAKALLKEKKISVADIGVQVGYPNTSYFIQVFKKATGMKPIEYAKRAGKS